MSPMLSVTYKPFMLSVIVMNAVTLSAVAHWSPVTVYNEVYREIG